MAHGCEQVLMVTSEEHAVMMGQNYMMMAFVICTFWRLCYGDLSQMWVRNIKQQKTISATLLCLVWNNNTVALLRRDRETNSFPG